MKRDIAFLERRKETGIWYFRYKDPANSRWRRKSLKTTSRPEAEDRYHEAFSDIKARRRPERPSVAEALNLWLAEVEEREVGDKHWAAVNRAADELRLSFGGLDLREVTRSKVREHLKTHRHREGVGARNKLALYRMFFRWAVAERLITSDPAYGLGGLLSPTKPPKRTPRISDPDLEALIADLEADIGNGAGGASLIPLVRFLALTGVRSIDAVRLRWEDVDLEARLVRVCPGRGKGHSRFLPWPGTIAPQSKLGGSVFGLTKTQLEGRWRRFKGRNPKWRGTSLHSLRVRVNSKLVEAGHEALARAMLGHADVDMTAHYTRIFGTEELAALTKL